MLVAGFQGVSTSTHDVTTLGRGGSDTTAVALAAALGADACEIFTDVAGVFTADPRIVPDALKLDDVTYEEMLEMSASGAKVMALRSIEIARSYGVKLRVRSTFVRRRRNLDRRGGRGNAREGDHLRRHARHLGGEGRRSSACPTGPASPRGSSARSRDAGVNIDMIVQNVSQNGEATSIRSRCRRRTCRSPTPILEQLATEIGATGVEHDPDIAKISLVGAGMKSHPGVAADMFDALAEAGINIEIISTSSIRISCVIRAADVERAVQAVHERFRRYAEERVGA